MDARELADLQHHLTTLFGRAPIRTPSDKEEAVTVAKWAPLVDIVEHRLASRSLEWRSDATATVVLVAKGYPGRFESGKPIAGLHEASRIEGVKVYHAGTHLQDGTVYTSGGRVLNVTARGGTLAEALNRAYFVAEMIEFEGKDYRRDIGRKGLAKQR